MAKVYLVCGKICSGKTFYTNRLKEETNAIVLSCDEALKVIFPYPLEETHDEVVARIKLYLFNKSIDIIKVGVNVILEFGFWSKIERANVSEFYRKHNVLTEWHYVDIPDTDWKRNIQDRNDLVLSGKSTDFFVDKGLLQKLDSLFDVPAKEEINCWFVNTRSFE